MCLIMSVLIQERLGAQCNWTKFTNAEAEVVNYGTVIFMLDHNRPTTTVNRSGGVPKTSRSGMALPSLLNKIC